jgi:hypothetical protein
MADWRSKRKKPNGLPPGAQCSPEDLDLAMSRRWHFGGHGVRRYVSFRDKNAGTNVSFHRLVFERMTGAQPLPGFEIDHINRDRLDNRRDNLRAVEHRYNMQNRGLDANNTSGYRGVVYRKKENRWAAQAETSEGGRRRNHTIGYFVTPEGAHTAVEIWRQANMPGHIPGGAG